MSSLCQAKQGVEIEMREDGAVMWVNVDGVCQARVNIGPNVPVEIKIPSLPNITIVQGSGRTTRR